MPCFTWRQGERAGDPHVENRGLSAHPTTDGILFTMRSNMVDRNGKMFNNTQSSIFLEFEQIITMANFLLVYLQEINDRKNNHELP